MEKIVKLEEFNWVSGRDAITIALCNTIIRKQNEIIDHLNSQDQEENEPEKVYVDPIVPDFIAEKLAEERYNTREILLNGTKPLEVEDTPEEWEKKTGEVIESVVAELSVSENMEKVERFFREAPIDYDDKCRLWWDFLDNLLNKKK